MTARASSPTTSPARAAGDDGYPEYKRGVLAGVASYAMWGVLPLFWPLLKPAGPVEILAHRMVWSLLFVLAVLWVTGGFGRFRAVFRDRRRLGLLTIAAALITVNWGAYIWGVNNGHVVETALGYFMGPLVSVVVGVLLLGERLRGLQWGAVGLGTVAVVVLAIGYGRPPWVAFLLAFPFAVYGLVKKLAATGAVESLAVETALTSVPALVYLGFLEGSGGGTLATEGIGHALLLLATGAATALPLLAFGAAATRIPLSMVGLLQYIAPVLQFLLGVLVFREHMPAERWVGFALVWLGLVILGWDGVRTRRRVEVR